MTRQRAMGFALLRGGKLWENDWKIQGKRINNKDHFSNLVCAEIHLGINCPYPVIRMCPLPGTGRNLSHSKFPERGSQRTFVLSQLLSVRSNVKVARLGVPC